MAAPIPFKEQTQIIRGNGDDVMDLPVHIEVTQADEHGAIQNGIATSCWRLSPDEIAEIIISGKIYIRQWGLPISHISCHGNNPFRT